MRVGAIVLAFSAAMALCASSAGADVPLPIRFERAGVVVRAEKGLEDVAQRVAESAASELERIYDDLDGLPRPPAVEVRLVEQTTDIAAAAPRPGTPPWAVGVAFSSDGVVVAARRRGAEILDIENTVAHELAHLALGAALGGRAPRWLNEGFAYLHSSDWSFARFRTLVSMAWSNDVIELWQLDRAFPREEAAAHRAYAQSYDFVAFLARRGRYSDTDDDGNPWPFRRFLAAIAAGRSLEEAATESFSTRLTDLFDEWRRGLRARYLLVPAETVGLLVWCLGAVLLVIGFLRRRSQNKATLARWEIEESATEARNAAPPLSTPAPSDTDPDQPT